VGGWIIVNVDDVLRVTVGPVTYAVDVVVSVVAYKVCRWSKQAARTLAKAVLRRTYDSVDVRYIHLGLSPVR
jgi:hypothetical protein